MVGCELLVPGYGADESNRHADAEDRTRCQQGSPDPNGLSLTKCFRHPATFGSVVDEPLVVSESGCAEDGDGSSNEKLWADQKTGPLKECGYEVIWIQAAVLGQASSTLRNAASQAG